MIHYVMNEISFIYVLWYYEVFDSEKWLLIIYTSLES